MAVAWGEGERTHGGAVGVGLREGEWLVVGSASGLREYLVKGTSG